MTETCPISNLPADVCICSEHTLEKGIWGPPPSEPLAGTFSAPYTVECAICGTVIEMGEPISQTRAGWTCVNCAEEGL